jgi:hypothetical protein
MIMSAMRLEKLRQVDLNLLITFAAVAPLPTRPVKAFPRRSS